MPIDHYNSIVAEILVFLSESEDFTWGLHVLQHSRRDFWKSGGGDGVFSGEFFKNKILSLLSV